MKKTYITTSIAYINAEPHIGFLLELVAADVIARQARLNGEAVFFLTGTDEHGSKIAQAAEAAGLEPQAYADKLSESFHQLGADFDISFDYFIRTTNPGHQHFVQERWQQLQAKGALEKRTYQGQYCVGCEAFKTDREIVEGTCAIHETPLEKVEEENWFFKLSDYRDQILQWLESGPVVQPEGRLNEIKNVVRELEDISFSRPKDKLGWGIPVPGDETQTMYVWADALWNYLSAIELAGEKTDQIWPADVQIIGKDILKFHAAIWPGLLIALGYELPKQILVHGFVSVEGKKMSKSLGNVVTPAELKDRYGAEATRYLLLRQLSFFDDSNFVWSEFDAIYNGELANGLGNLVARAIGLAKKVPEAAIKQREKFEPVVFPDFAFDLQTVNALVKEADRIVTKEKIWLDPDKKVTELSKVLGIIAELADRLEAYLPHTAAEIRRQLKDLDPKPLFPRLEINS